MMFWLGYIMGRCRWLWRVAAFILVLLFLIIIFA